MPIIEATVNEYDLYATFHCCKHWVCMRVLEVKNGVVEFEIPQPEFMTTHTQPVELFKNKIESGEYLYCGRLSEHIEKECPNA